MAKKNTQSKQNTELSVPVPQVNGAPKTQPKLKKTELVTAIAERLYEKWKAKLADAKAVREAAKTRLDKAVREHTIAFIEYKGIESILSDPDLSPQCHHTGSSYHDAEKEAASHIRLDIHIPTTGKGTSKVKQAFLAWHGSDKDVDRIRLEPFAGSPNRRTWNTSTWEIKKEFKRQAREMVAKKTDRVPELMKNPAFVEAIDETINGLEQPETKAVELDVVDDDTATDKAKAVS
jgi:hypothetical protein